jgi:hypothetical protein
LSHRLLLQHGHLSAGTTTSWWAAASCCTSTSCLTPQVWLVDASHLLHFVLTPVSNSILDIPGKLLRRWANFLRLNRTKW